MMARSLSRGFVTASLAALILIQGILLALWLRRDSCPPMWDPAVHLMSAWRYREAVKEGPPARLLQTKTSPGHPPYPPVVHDIMAIGMSLAGPFGVSPEKGAIFSQLFFIALLAIGSYLVASSFWGAGAGLVGAVLVTFAPAVQALAHQALIDLGLVAFVVLAYAFWLKSDGFSRRGWSLALGAVVGVGCLTKWTFPTYILPVMVSAGLKLTDRKQGWNIFFAVGTAVLLSAPWYVINLPILIPKLSRVSHLGAQEGDPSGATLAGWFCYARWIWSGWSAPLVLGGIAGMIWGFFRRTKSAVILGTWFLTSYAVWSLVSNKDPRYLAPAAVILPIAFAALPFRFPALGALAAGIWATLAVFAAPGHRWMDSPVSAVWPLDEMIAKVETLRDQREGPSVLTLVSNHAFLNGNNLTWTAMKRRVSQRVVVRTKMDPLGQLTDFVLVKTGDLGPEHSITRQRVARDEIFLKGGWFGRSFVEAARWSLPDGSEAVLFQCRTGLSGSVSASKAGDFLRVLLPRSSWTDFRASVREEPGFPGEMTALVTAEELRVESLTVRRVEFLIRGLRMALDNEGKPRLIHLRRLEARSAQWTEEDARAFLAQRLPQIQGARVAFLDENRVRIGGAWGPVPMELEIKLSVGSVAEGTQRLGMDVLQIRLGGLAFPSRERVLLHRDIALSPSGSMPYDVRLAGLRTRLNRLDILTESP